MRRVCKRPIQIDALTLCYEVEQPFYYEQLSNLDYGECLDLYEFQLYRTEEDISITSMPSTYTTAHETLSGAT